MKIEVGVGVSKKHVHMREETWNTLFPNQKMEKRNDLNQPGKFASTATVDILLYGKMIYDVRVVGPFYSYNQLEISNQELESLDFLLPSRKSGDLKGTPSFTFMNNEYQVESQEGAIRAQNHIHISSELALKYHLQDDEKISFFNDTVKLGDAYIKISSPAFFELHLDLDEASKVGLQNGDKVFIEVSEE